jgi:predicted RNA methylase
MNVSVEVLDVLSNAEINQNTLKLIGQLDRNLYTSVNKALEAAGGKWNRKVKAHIFDNDAVEIMDSIILTGKIVNKKQELGYFPTPKNIVDYLIDLANIEPNMLALEPSAGQGAIAEEIKKITPNLDCFELDSENAKILSNKGLKVLQCDFLLVEPAPMYDRIVMNPPFAKQADIHHVNHAFKFLKAGGRLVSVMASGVIFRSNRLTQDFRNFVDDHDGEIENLPDGSFSESGTQVNTVIVTINA